MKQQVTQQTNYHNIDNIDIDIVNKHEHQHQLPTTTSTTTTSTTVSTSSSNKQQQHNTYLHHYHYDRQPPTSPQIGTCQLSGRVGTTTVSISIPDISSQETQHLQHRQLKRDMQRQSMRICHCPKTRNQRVKMNQVVTVAREGNGL